MIEKEESPLPRMSAVSFSEDGQSLFSISASKVHRWDLAAKGYQEVISTNGPREFIDAMTFSNDGRLLTLASNIGRVYIWEPISVLWILQLMTLKIGQLLLYRHEIGLLPHLRA